MTEMRSILERAETAIWDALCDDADSAAPRVRAIIREVEDAFGSASGAESAAAIGYFWYLMPGSSPERAKSGIQWLKQALALDDRNALARLYLGHFHYDAGEFDEAMSHLEQIEPGYFSDLGQRWRDLKVRELIAASALCTGRLDRADLERFIADHDAAAEEDKANPDEIVAAARASTKGETRSDEVGRILDWARRLGYGDV